MPVSQFPCPHCHSLLRIQNRAYLGREVDCPDCGRPIRIVRGDGGGLQAEAVGAAAVPAVEREPSGLSLPAWGGTLRALATPTRVAWTLAGLLALGLLIVVWPFGGGSNAGTDMPAPPDDPALAVNPPDDDHSGANGLPTIGPAADPDNPAGPAGAGDPVAKQQLERIGERLREYAARHGQFPPGTVGADLPPEQQFGWLARLTAEREPGFRPVPQWDQPYSDPLNEPFTRRARPELLNPLVPRKAGADRYPATHYAGVGGVGADAPGLPVTHPRAGLFGYDRKTRPEDVADGLSNTMAAAGVRDRLGSWAGGGAATVRPFVREPYINGPDGFGTGQPDGMFVLMADGRVQLLSEDTHPEVVRRLAAISDGQPLNPADPTARPPDAIAARDPDDPPVDHGKLPAVPVPPAPVGPNPPDPSEDEPNEDEPPAEAPADPPEPMIEIEPVDIAAALAVRIERFDQSRSVPFRELLGVIEEMVGVPIRYDAAGLGPAADRLDERITLQVSDVTVGELVAAVAAKIGLEYEAAEDHLRLRLAGNDQGPMTKAQ